MKYIRIQKLTISLMALTLLSLALLIPGPSIQASAEQLPAAPMMFKGSVTVNGDPNAADGFFIVAKVLDYQTKPVPIQGGRYGEVPQGFGKNTQLFVNAPQDVKYRPGSITFYIIWTNESGITAASEVYELKYVALPFLVELDLSFPFLPDSLPAPTPIPTPIPTPVATATPEPKSPGDANGDKRVDFRDVAIITSSYGMSSVSVAFDNRADFNEDGIIDVLDLAILGAYAVR
jgi:hypothetical protein